MDSWDVAFVTIDDLEPLRELLVRARYVQATASGLLVGTEQEYQLLRNTDLSSVGESLRRFRFLCWVRGLLREFVNKQVVASQFLALGARLDLIPFPEDSDSSGSDDEGPASSVSALPSAA
jgi:hypothetical protein